LGALRAPFVAGEGPLPVPAAVLPPLETFAPLTPLPLRLPGVLSVVVVAVAVKSQSPRETEIVGRAGARAPIPAVVVVTAVASTVPMPLARLSTGADSSRSGLAVAAATSNRGESPALALEEEEAAGELPKADGEWKEPKGDSAGVVRAVVTVVGFAVGVLSLLALEIAMLLSVLLSSVTPIRGEDRGGATLIVAAGVVTTVKAPLPSKETVATDTCWRAAGLVRRAALALAEAGIAGSSDLIGIAVILLRLPVCSVSAFKLTTGAAAA
jgi:hypothetical protein